MKDERRSWLRLALLVSYGVLLMWALNNPAAIGAVWKSVKSLAAPFLYGISFAFLLNLPMTFFEGWLLPRLWKSPPRWFSKLYRPLAILLSCLCVGTVLGLLSGFVIPQLVESCSTLAESLPAYYAVVESFIKEYAGEYPAIEPYVEEIIGDWREILSSMAAVIRQVVPNVLETTQRVASGIAGLGLGLIFTLYLLADKERYLVTVGRLVDAYLPERLAGKLKSVAARTAKTLRKYISGQITEACIMGFLCYLGMNLLGLSYPLLIGVIIGASGIIPIFGAWLGTIPSVFILLMVNPVQAAIFVAFLLCLQLIEENLIYPRVVGESIGLEGFWVLTAIFVGGRLLGFIGILLGVPIFAVCYALVEQDVKNRLKKKGIERASDNDPV